MLVRSKFFYSFVENIEKLELSLSKQHNKMLKIRSEMLKIIKKCQNNQARQTFSGKFPGNFPNPENPKDFRDSGNFRDSREIFRKFPVYRQVENPGKRETLLIISLGYVSMTSSLFINVKIDKLKYNSL